MRVSTPYGQLCDIMYWHAPNVNYIQPHGWSIVYFQSLSQNGQIFILFPSQEPCLFLERSGMLSQSVVVGVLECFFTFTFTFTLSDLILDTHPSSCQIFILFQSPCQNCQIFILFKSPCQNCQIFILFPYETPISFLEQSLLLSTPLPTCQPPSPVFMFMLLALSDLILDTLPQKRAGNSKISRFWLSVQL